MLETGEWFRLVLLVLVVLAVILFEPASPFVTQTTEEKTTEDVRFVQPVDNGSSRLWPYTSRGESFGKATLPINVVVRGDAATVQRLLAYNPQQGRPLYWDATSERWTVGDPGEANVTINGTGIHWGEAKGTNRYTFVMTNDSSRWMPATYQLHAGTYFGSQYHLRLYQGGSDNQTWTAIQAHHEYWDWFRLRHDVNSLTQAQHFVERDFLGTGLVAEMSRERWENGGAIDADGWVTVIELRQRVTLGPLPLDQRHPSSNHYAFVFPLVGLALAAYLEGLRAVGRDYLQQLRESRLSLYHVALFASTATLPLVVRVGAIAAERAVPRASPVIVGGPFYLLLVIGLPVSALVFGRYLSMTDGFTVSVLGLGTGIMADYAYLGLAAIPYGALVHRLVLLFGLGLIGAGGTRWSTEPIPRHRYHIAGFGIWTGMLLWPLLGFG